MLFLEATQAQAVVSTILSSVPRVAVQARWMVSGPGFTGGVGVTFNGVASSSFAFLTDTQVTATVPFGGTTDPLSVVTPAGTATSSTVFTVTFGGPTAVDCTTDPSALQPAINAAAAGQTLDITGTCIGTFTVSKDLTLEGQERLSMLEVAVPRSPSPLAR